MNSPLERFLRLVAYRDEYAGFPGIELRDRRRLVLERWAALPNKRDRERYRRIAHK